MQVSTELAPIDMLESDGLPMNNGCFMTLGQRLRAIAHAEPDREAIADSSGCVLTYGQVLERAEQLVHWLTTERAAERNIGVYLPSSTVAALANYAITLAGKVAVNLNFTVGEQHCRAAVEVCGLQTIFTSRAFLAKLGIEPMAEMVFVEDLRTEGNGATSVPHSGPDSTACILFSSGTTGVPKGIQLTHWNILANAAGLAARLPPSASDCLLGVLPFFHSFGYTFALWFPVLYGIRAAFHGNPTDARTIGELAEKYKTTYLLSTPTLCQQYARKLPPHQFASLKYVLVGAEKLRDSIATLLLSPTRLTKDESARHRSPRPRFGTCMSSILMGRSAILVLRRMSGRRSMRARFLRTTATLTFPC